MRNLLTALSILLILSMLLAACSVSAIPRQNAATRTARAAQNRKQATRMAELLQDTQLAGQAMQTATLQARRTQTAQAELDQQGTIEAGTATEDAYAAQRTAEAVELQRQIEDAQKWPALIVDTFDQPAFDWPTGSEKISNGNMAWKLANGKSIWRATAEHGFTFWTYPISQAVSDFYLSIEVKQTSGAPDSEAGLVFHASDQEFWCYLISGAGDLFIGLRVNNEWQLSIPFGSSTVNSNGPNHLAIIDQDSKYIFLINGYSFISLGEDTLPTGPAGLMITMWNAGDQASWEFDNYELRVPGTPIPLTSPTP
jgi:hypothetical protein